MPTLSSTLPWAALVVAAALSSSCAVAPPAPRGAPALVARSLAPRSPDPLALVETIAISELACRYRAQILGSTQPLRLCFAGGDICWADLVDDHISGPLELELGAGSPVRAVVRFEDSGMRLTGFIAPRLLLLYPVRFQAFGGFLLPSDLHLVDSAPGSLTLEPALEPTVIAHVPLREPRRCEEIDTEPQSSSSSPEAAPLFVAGRPDGARKVLAAERVPLSLQPRGEPVATLLTTGDEDDNLVLAFDEAEGYTRILKYSQNTIFGWVPTSALATPRATLGGSHRSRSPGLWVREPDPAAVVCGHRVRLFARAAGRTAEVGEVEPHERLAIVRADDAFVRVSLRREVFSPARWGEGGALVPTSTDPSQARRVVEKLRLAPNAELLALHAEVDGCPSAP